MPPFVPLGGQSRRADFQWDGGRFARSVNGMGTGPRRCFQNRQTDGTERARPRAQQIPEGRRR
jgi:hypothetical protein